MCKAVVIKVVLELGVRHLVTILKYTIRLRVLLNRVVRKMDILIIGVVGVYGKLRRRRSQVSLGEEVKRGVIVYEYPHSNVKLPLVYQEWLFDVLLQNERVMLYLILLLLCLLWFLSLCWLLSRCLLIIQSASCFLLTLVERRESRRRLGGW
jgi:hypothetical protein